MKSADTISCDEALAALALDRGAGRDRATTGADPVARALAHRAGCDRCQAERARAEQVSHALAHHQVAAPAPAADAAFRSRLLAAAAPLLARRAYEARALRRRVAWAFTLALLPLPAILYANFKLLLAAHGLLSTLVPPSVSLYLVACLGAGVALLLALSYAAVPVMAARRPWLFALEESDVVHSPA
jgi:hypothetical protein